MLSVLYLKTSETNFEILAMIAFLLIKLICLAIIVFIIMTNAIIICALIVTIYDFAYL